MSTAAPGPDAGTPPNDPAALNDRAATLVREGGADALREAERCYRLAIEAAPSIPELHFNLGNLLRDTGRRENAAASFRAAIARRARYAKAWNNLGRLEEQDGRADEAERCYRNAVQSDPGLGEGRYNLGRVMLEAGDAKSAVELLEASLALGFDVADLHNVLGAALQRLGSIERAETCYRRAIADTAGKVPAYRMNLGLLLMLSGRYEEGFREYEHRLETPLWREPARYAGRRWDGKPLGSRSLVLWAEQGFGDTIQFVRFLPLLRKRHPDATLLLACPRVLHRLLAPLAQRCRVGLRAPDEDDGAGLSCPLLSLSGRLNIAVTDIPAAAYLGADAALAEQWSARLAHLVQPRVGLAWAGARGWQLDPRRSLAPALLEPLARLRGIGWVSLQKDAGAPLPAQLHEQVFDPMAEVHDFADTAAIISMLDLVVSVDTSVAHLAGATGKPVWLLNRFDSDWRWGAHGVNTPWYPETTILRQRVPQEWEMPLAALLRQLETLVSGGAQRAV